MKKENLKIFAISFAIVYVMIASLCVLNRKPLIYVRGYNFSQFFTLFIFLGLISSGLVFVMDILEKIHQKFLTPILSSPISIYAYYILVSVFGLFAFTLFAGLVEAGQPFYLYGCVTNSCIYLFSGYTVTFVAAVYFAYRFIKGSLVKAKL